MTTKKDETKLPDLSPNLHHAPPLNENINEDCHHKENKTKPVVLTQTHHHHQDRHLNANSKHHHLPRASTATSRTQGQRLDCG